MHADALLFFMLCIKLSANDQGKLCAASTFSDFLGVAGLNKVSLSEQVFSDNLSSQ